MIDRDSPIPLYYQLKGFVRRQIEIGELRPGDRLPTEMELCEQFEISRAPVRQALTELAREGLIYRRPGQGSFVAPIAPASLAQKIKVRVLSHYDVRWMTSLEQAVLRWNIMHREQEVQLDVQMCSRDDYHQILRRSVIQGDAPDIAPMDYVWVTHYASDGYIVPLDDLDEAWVRDLHSDIEAPVLRNNTVDGKLCGLPVQADLTGLWYRRDWFKAEGLTPPMTWPQWLDLIDYFGAPGVKERLGHLYSIVLPVTSSPGEATVNLLIAFLWMMGGDIVDASGALMLDDPKVCAAMRYLQKITIDRRDMLPADVHRSRWWDLVRFFAHGAVPMALGGSYEWPRIREESEWDGEEEAAEKLGFVLLPRPTIDVKPIASLGGTSWAIFKQSPVQDICLEILKMVAMRDVSQAFCEENLQISPYVSVNQKFMKPEHPWLSVIVPMLQSARPRPMMSTYIRVSRVLQEMFERVLWDGVPAEQAVKSTAQILSLVVSEDTYS